MSVTGFNFFCNLRSKVIIILLSLLSLNACTHGHCPDPLDKNKKITDRVWVYKYDQSKQCGVNKGVELTKMQKDFDKMGVDVFESKKQYDGLMRIQACGAFTGLANMFLIKKTDLNKVTSRGYQQWDF